MKKLFCLSFALLLSFNTAAATEPCTNTPIVTECPSGKHLAEILTSAQCLQTQCLTLDEVALAAESTLSLPEELSEEDLEKVDTKFDTANNLLNIFNQEVSNRRTELAELKQTAARIESDPEAYAQELKVLLEELGVKEEYLTTVRTSVQQNQSQLQTSISQLEQLIEQKGLSGNSNYQNLLQNYKGTLSLSLRSRFDLKLLKAQTNDPQEAPETIQQYSQETIERVSGEISNSQAQIESINTSLSSYNSTLSNLNQDIAIIDNAQEFLRLRETSGINGIITEDSINAKIEATTDPVKKAELETFRDLYTENQSNPKFGQTVEVIATSTPEEITAQKEEIQANIEAQNRARSEQATALEAEQQKVRDLEKEKLAAEADYSEASAQLTNDPQEAQRLYEEAAAKKQELALQQSDPAEKARLQQEALQNSYQANEATRPTDTNSAEYKTYQENAAILSARQDIAAAGAGDAEIDAKIDEIEGLRREKQGLENNLKTAQENVRKAEEALNNAAPGISPEERQKLEEDLDKALEGEMDAQTALYDRESAIESEIVTKEVELAALEETQKTLNAERQAARNTLSKQKCVYQDATGNNIYSTEYCVELDSPIGETKSIHGKTGLDLLRNYIGVMYRYFASIIGILAVLVIVVSGIQMSMAGFNSEFSSQAKTRIFQALASLILLFLISLILRTVNPLFFTKAETTGGNEITVKV